MVVNGTTAPAFTIGICYRDAKGGEHCGANAFRRRFMALPPGVKTPPDVQPVPAGRWYQETFDLILLTIPPASFRYSDRVHVKIP